MICSPTALANCVRGPKRTFEAGARNLERVPAARHRVVAVEEAGQLPCDFGDGVEIDASSAVDDHAEQARAQLEVDELEARELSTTGATAA